MGWPKDLGALGVSAKKQTNKQKRFKKRENGLPPTNNSLPWAFTEHSWEKLGMGQESFLCPKH